MSDPVSSVAATLSEDVSPSYFPGWHPLKSEWLEELAFEVKEIAQYAQQCLADDQRSDKELADAIMQIKIWRQANPELVDGKNAPEVIRNESLGNQLELAIFVDLLLAQAFAAVLKPYEFAALALLQEAAGLADLDAVAKKDALSAGAQHLTLKIARLHWAIVLLRMLDKNPRQQETIRTLLTSLFNVKMT